MGTGAAAPLLPIAGTLASGRAVKRIPEPVFRQVVAVIIGLLGLSMLR